MTCTLILAALLINQVEEGVDANAPDKPQAVEAEAAPEQQESTPICTLDRPDRSRTTS